MHESQSGEENPLVPQPPDCELHFPDASQRPKRIAVDGFALCLQPHLDMAEGWNWCDDGEGCPMRAFANQLYPSEAGARRAIVVRTSVFAEKVFNARRRQPGDPVVARGWDEGFPMFQIIHIAGSFLGRDYRESGCQIADAYEQLAYGYGTEPAWSVVRSHHQRRFLGALLPGESSKGALFVFSSGRSDLTETIVGEIKGTLRRSNEQTA